jgi:tight adherence protein B
MEFLVFFLILSVAVVFTIVIANNVMRKRDVDQMRDLVSGKDPLAGKGAVRQKSLMKTDAKPTRERVASAVLGQDLNQRLRNFIEQAGVDWDPARTVFTALILGVFGFNFFWYIVPRGEPISFIGLIAGLGGPFLYIYMRRRTRMRKFEAQFPDALEFASRAMRSGHAFSVSLEMLHKEYGPPLGAEFQRTFEEQNLGLPLEIALERLGKRVPLLDVQFFVSAVLLQKRTGGNLAGLLDNLAYLIRERFKLRGRIRAVSAHGRISGLVLSMIPLVVALLMFLTNPEYILFFLDDPDGKIMLVVCIFLQLLGFISIRKIVDIGV